MALLITLSVIGGITTLVGLYLLGIELSAYIVAHTSMFKERVDEIKKSRKDRKLAKQKEKAEKKALKEEVEQVKEKTELEVELNNVIDEISK